MVDLILLGIITLPKKLAIYLNISSGIEISGS
jgi:hypothetical protein